MDVFQRCQMRQLMSNVVLIYMVHHDQEIHLVVQR
jgi:hypothetical protein